MDTVLSQLYTYNDSTVTNKDAIEDFSFFSQPSPGHSYWLNLHGIHDVELIEKIGATAGFDRLTIRQLLDTTQRSKAEHYLNYLFLNVKSILKGSDGSLLSEQISFVLGPHYIVSFQEEVGDHFEGVRNRLRQGLGLVRHRKADYLLALLLDAILDNYFESMEQINKEIVSLEQEVFMDPSKESLIRLEAQKGTAQIIKRSLRSFNEVASNISNQPSVLFEKENIRYFKALENSTTAAIDEIDTTLKNMDGLTNIYFASLSQKMNEIMKMLTTVATIFIPLTFLAGIYGMNFDYMPELKYRYGYFMVWGTMVLIVLVMVIFFRRKKWF